MFSSLYDLTANGRTLSVHITRVGPDADATLRVSVIPVVKDATDATKGLATPLVMEGTAAELDAEFATQLAQFQTTRAGLISTLDEAKKTMDAAAEAAKASAKEKLDKAKTAAKPAPKTAPKAAAVAVAPITPKAPETVDLFSGEATPVAVGVGADATDGED
jgi:PRTRC genetic system protein E